jgi:hypothetical protein
MTVVMRSSGQTAQQTTEPETNSQSLSETSQQSAISTPLETNTSSQSLAQNNYQFDCYSSSRRFWRQSNSNVINSDNSEDISSTSQSQSQHKSNESVDETQDVIEVSNDSNELEAKEELAEDEEPDFPIHELNKLDDMINKPRWVIPVLPKGELEILLEATIKLCKQGYDVRSEACQRFIRDGLTISFTKILTDEAVNGWKFEIHVIHYMII